MPSVLATTMTIAYRRTRDNHPTLLEQDRVYVAIAPANCATAESFCSSLQRVFDPPEAGGGTGAPLCCSSGLQRSPLFDPAGGAFREWQRHEAHHFLVTGSVNAGKFIREMAKRRRRRGNPLTCRSSLSPPASSWKTCRCCN